MHRLAKKMALVATLALLLPVTIVCDLPALDDVYDAFDFEVYHDYDDDCCRGCWFGCDDDDDWSFDFDWWW